MMRVRRRHLGSIVLAGLLLVVAAGSAAARPALRDAGTYDNPWTDTFCGFDVEGRDFGRFEIAEATKATDYQFFYFTNWYNGHTKITNPANGKWITEDWSGRYQEVGAHQETSNPNVFRFGSTDVAHYVVKSASGDVIHREIDTVVTTRLFDTLGDRQPGGNELEYRELVNTVDQSFDLCAVAKRLIG
jgi:hypothetical protein